MAHIRTKQAAQKNWFISDKGKQYSFYSVNVLTTAITVGHILPQTCLVSTYRDLVRLYSKGFSVPVPDKVIQRFNKTVSILKLKDEFLYTPFMASGFDIYSLGVHGKFGVHVGIPINFGYESVEDIDKSKILINQESVIWESDAGKQLLESLVVPENGQMYAIAKEIKLRNSYKLYFDTIYATLACLLTYGGSTKLNQKLNLYNKPRQIRFIGYALMAMLGVGNYFMCKDFTQNYYEEKIDRELKELSPVFAEGGKQFYTQILERNKALRVLMGKDGENVYTVLGNENFLFRHKHRPIVQRKAFFEEKSTSQPEETNFEAM